MVTKKVKKIIRKKLYEYPIYDRLINELELEKIFEYANKINNLKPIKRLYELGGENVE